VAGVAIGPYQLVRLLGEGGMGAVYLARQTHPIRRDVALKIIKPGMDSRQVIARFESERQALALMEHPNIARVLDAGQSDAGYPFFVMELVEGIPITRYCDSKRLTLRERIELYIPACEAIQHAHQKGILHRDIKPSNVLVSHDGTPKVIDFGLAKALGPELNDATMVTGLGAVVGTLEYMSPEQAEIGRHDIDTRSDLYSLGALLYELLTGKPPLLIDRGKTSYVDALSRVREEAPAAPSLRLRRSDTLTQAAANRRIEPSKLPKLLNRELDWVVMKTLEKDRSRRYETVNGLVRDLQRYLAQEPVEAGPPSAGYRARKFVQRHRLGLGTAAAFMALLIAGVVVSLWMAARASRAEQIARAVNEFLQRDLLAQAGPEEQAAGARPDPEIKVRTLLDRAAAGIAGKFGANPAVEAAIRSTIGASYRDLGLHAQAIVQFQRALDLDRRVWGNEHPDTLAAAKSLGQAYYSAGKYPQAEAALAPAVEVSRRNLGTSNSQTRDAMSALGLVYVAEAKYELARPLLTEALEVQRRMPGAENPVTFNMEVNLARLHFMQGNFAEAERLLSLAVQGARDTLGPEHPVTLSFMNNLSVVYQNQYRYPEAEGLLSQVLEARRHELGPEHPDTLNAMQNLATLYSADGRFSQAEPLFVKALEASRRVLGPEHPKTLGEMANLAILYVYQKRFPEASALIESAVNVSRRVLGAENPETLLDLYVQGALYREEGRYAAAEPLLAQLVESERRVFGPRNPRTEKAMDLLGLVRNARKDYPGAETVLRECDAARRQSAPDSFLRYATEAALGDNLVGQRRYQEAEALLIPAWEGMQERLAKADAGDRPKLVEAGHSIIRLYKDSGQAAKAAEWTERVRQAQPAADSKVR
jgi:non-specific serine/threonine protein kinase/serine/threonine-protein kinase